MLKNYETQERIWVVFYITLFTIIGLGIILALASFGFNISDEYLTGYIYSTNTIFDATHGEIRFSENAGQDKQPSFCVYGEEAEKAKKLTGSGIKVKIHVKPTGFHFKGIFGCSADTEIEVLEEE